MNTLHIDKLPEEPPNYHKCPVCQGDLRVTVHRDDYYEVERSEYCDACTYFYEWAYGHGREFMPGMAEGEGLHDSYNETDEERNDRRGRRPDLLNRARGVWGQRNKRD